MFVPSLLVALRGLLPSAKSVSAVEVLMFVGGVDPGRPCAGRVAAGSGDLRGADSGVVAGGHQVAAVGRQRQQALGAGRAAGDQRLVGSRSPSVGSGDRLHERAGGVYSSRKTGELALDRAALPSPTR